jgi:hypothetical protein
VHDGKVMDGGPSSGKVSFNHLWTRVTPKSD